MKFQLDTYAVSGIPQWVSEMGLEWLYTLLIESNNLWRGMARQS